MHNYVITEFFVRFRRTYVVNNTYFEETEVLLKDSLDSLSLFTTE